MTLKFKMWRWFSVLLWTLLGLMLLVVMVAAIQRKSNRNCAGMEISISGVKNHFFVDRDEVAGLVMKVTGKNIQGRPTKDFDLRKIEENVESSKWVKNAEIFFDNKNRLHVKVEESEPIARIFNTAGHSFYIDETLHQLPLSDRYSARLPVFTNFSGDDKKWKDKDSVLMRQIKDLSLFIQADSFWMAQIEQVDITSDREMILIPKVGDHVILFGEGEDIEKKFRRLYIFYQDVLRNIGWSQYATINVQYKGQVIGVKKDKGEIRADTLLARQWIKQIIQNAQQQVSDDTLNRAQQNYGAKTPVKLANPDTQLMKNTASEHYEDPGKSGISEEIPPKPREKKQPKAIMPPVKNR